MSPARRSAPIRALRSGSSSQGLLVTLLGDYWFGRTVYIPSAALVDLLGEFGISPQAARAALSRVQRAGYLEGARDGRYTAYRLSPEAAERGTRMGHRIMRFSAETPSGAPPWDGRWTVVAYALQAEQAEERRRIRASLRSLGFGALQDAVWISPRRLAGRVRDAVGSEPALSLTVFEDADLAAGVELDVERVWRLDDIADRYHEVIEVLEEITPTLARGATPSPREALVMRTEAMERWRTIPAVDPRLPPPLLPKGWPGWQARRLFARVYDRLGPMAADHVRAVVAPHSADAADAVRHDSVADPR